MTKREQYLEYFILFSFGGWIYESIWCSMIEQNIGFVNRGFFHGPWLPIYGFGMLFITFVVKKLKLQRWYFVFVVSCLIACICELIGSYVMEFFTGSFMWNYSKDFLNFQGRIALRPELYFGFLSLLTNYMILPAYDKFREKHSWMNKVSLMIIILFFTDIIFSLIQQIT